MDSFSLRKPSNHSSVQTDGTEALALLAEKWWVLILCKGRYLVDPASSHMLVSKIKPCMSKYKLLIL